MNTRAVRIFFGNITYEALLSRAITGGGGGGGGRGGGGGNTDL